jgi:hypothetical protein
MPRESRRPPANEQGIEHLYISSDQPEAAELRSLVEKDWSKNVDHAKHRVFNPEYQQPMTARAPASAGEAARQQQLVVAANDPGNSVVGERTPAVVQAQKNLARQQSLRTGKPMP